MKVGDLLQDPSNNEYGIVTSMNTEYYCEITWLGLYTLSGQQVEPVMKCVCLHDEYWQIQKLEALIVQ
jgi:hypothetical protein